MRRQGFTLIEMLVVITLIGVLMALLLPAVNSVREAARALNCMSNLRGLGLACTNYESQMKEYPGYVNQMSVTTTSSGTPTILMVPWTVKLLPFLDKKDIYDVWAATNVAQSSATPTPTPLMSFLLCPSNLPDASFTNALAYVGNAGMRDYDGTTARRPDLQGLDLPGNGVFVNRFTGTLVMSRDSIKDGSNTTLLFSENCQAGSYVNSGGAQQGGWNVGPLSTATNGAGCPYAANGEKESEIQTCFVFFEDDTNNGLGTSSNSSTNSAGQQIPSRRINADKNYNYTPMSDSQRNYEHVRPSSQHPGGVNAIFCEGNTKFIPDSIDYAVYEQIMTSNSNQSSFINSSGILTIPIFDDSQLTN